MIMYTSKLKSYENYGGRKMVGVGGAWMVNARNGINGLASLKQTCWLFLREEVCVKA